MFIHSPQNLRGQAQLIAAFINAHVQRLPPNTEYAISVLDPESMINQADGMEKSYDFTTERDFLDSGSLVDMYLTSGMLDYSYRFTIIPERNCIHALWW